MAGRQPRRPMGDFTILTRLTVLDMSVDVGVHSALSVSAPNLIKRSCRSSMNTERWQVMSSSNDESDMENVG